MEESSSVCICLWHPSCFSPNCLSLNLPLFLFLLETLFLVHDSDAHSHSVFVEHFQHLLVVIQLRFILSAAPEVYPVAGGGRGGVV